MDDNGLFRAFYNNKRFLFKATLHPFHPKKQKLGRPRYRKWHETCSHITVLADPGSTPRVTSNSRGAEKSLSERPWIKTDGILTEGNKNGKFTIGNFCGGIKIYKYKGLGGSWSVNCWLKINQQIELVSTTLKWLHSNGLDLGLDEV